MPSRFGRLEDVPVPCCSSIQAVGSKRIAVRKLTTAAGPMGRKAEAERVERLDLARTLVGLARAVAKHSLVLSALEGVEVEDIAFLFGDRAPGTLRKHLSGWRRWASYCQGCAVDAGSPTAKELLDFLLALAEGARSDCGSQRVGAARGVVHAMKFMAFKLELHKFHTLLAGPTVCAWLSSAKWDRAPPNEALPLPLFAVCELEEAAASGAEEDSWVLGCLLLMLWGALRFSDGQRIDLASVQVEDGVIRGWCWRSKSSPTGFPWGVLTVGATGLRWGCKFANRLLALRAQDSGRDFLLSSDRGPLSYAAAVAQFRRCLGTYTTLEPTAVSHYTLHSLKATTLSWSLQISAPVEDRACQGHHRLRTATGSVEKYRRDDVLPALRCQRLILQSIGSGWVPQTALSRGASSIREHAPERVVDLRLLPGDVASGIVVVQDIQAAEPGEVSDSSCDSDTDAGSSSDEEVVQNGPWILNSTTGWYHKATHVDEGSDMGLFAPHGRVALSCRPVQALGAQYLVRTSDPFLEGYSRCHHSGC